MQEYGLLALVLTRQRSAQYYDTDPRNRWLDGGSQLPPLRLDAYEAARGERLRGGTGYVPSGPTRVSRMVRALRSRRDAKVESLGGLALFAGLSKQELREVARLVDTVELPSGHTFIREGESGREFFVIAEGTVNVSQNGQSLAQLGAGGWVGEIALMSAIPRTATVATRTPAKLFVTTERGFRQLVDGWRSIAAQIDQGLAERAAA